MQTPERTENLPAQPEVSKSDGLPDPVATFIYRDGMGEWVTRTMSIDDLTERKRQILEEQEQLLSQLKSINRRRAEARGRRGFHPRRELTQLYEGLRKQGETASSRLKFLGRQDERLEVKREIILKSDPKKPPVVLIEAGKEPVIESGRLLSESDADWFNFLRSSNLGHLWQHPGIEKARMVFELRREVSQGRTAPEELDRSMKGFNPPDELVPLYRVISKHLEAKRRKP